MAANCECGGKIKQRKCNKCGKKFPPPKREKESAFDRWANGNQQRAFNSDED